MNRKQKLPFRILGWFCPPQLLEEIEGDLLQKYLRDRKLLGEGRATAGLYWNVLRFFRPGILFRNKLGNELPALSLLENYLITAVRQAGRRKMNFAFKLGGLALALCCVMAVAIYVTHHLSFDTFHVQHQQVYRLGSHRKDNDAVEKYAITPLAVAPLIQQLPEVLNVSRAAFGGHTYLRSDDKVFDCEGMVEVDSTIFDVLTFQFLKGDKNALNNMSALVLTRSFALRMFGTTDVLQKLVSINGSSDLLQITGVIEDVPSNSHFYCQAMIRIRGHYDLTRRSIIDPVSFSDEAATTYVRLRPGAEQSFLAGANKLVTRFATPEVCKEFAFDLFLQPVAGIYLDDSYRYDAALHGNASYVFGFATLGMLLLLVAGINYVNLSVADYAHRARETGVRRVFGARVNQLAVQVGVETLAIGFVAFIMALAMLYGLFPAIASLLDPDLKFAMLFRADALTMVGTGSAALLLLSIVLPARQLQAMRVVHNLRSVGTGYNAAPSRILLFTQIGVSVLCLYCTLVVGKQVTFMYHKPLGFDRNNLLVLSTPSEFTVRKLQTLKTGLKEIPGVTAVSNSSFRIGGGYWKDWYFVEDGNRMREVELYEVFSDDELFSTLDIPVLRGRTFSSEMPADSGAAFVINETAARALGWDDPVGKRIYTHPEDKGKWDGTVVGVVADINISPLYAQVRPMVMRLPWQNSYPDPFIYVRYAGDEGAIVNAIEEKYKAVMPGYPLAWRQVDELYNGMHRKEARAFDSLSFGTLAIVVVSMTGIFSMAAFMSMKRMKEFGIRKVLGASFRQIAALHLGFFLRVTLVANAVFLPLAYGLMSEWMNSFAYHIPAATDLFVLVPGISVLLIVVSGAYPAIKSAIINPVTIIRNE